MGYLSTSTDYLSVLLVLTFPLPQPTTFLSRLLPASSGHFQDSQHHPSPSSVIATIAKPPSIRPERGAACRGNAPLPLTPPPPPLLAGDVRTGRDRRRRCAPCRFSPGNDASLLPSRFVLVPVSVLVLVRFNSFDSLGPLCSPPICLFI